MVLYWSESYICLWLWKSIRNWGGGEVLSHFRFLVDKGSWVRLWHGIWCGDFAHKIAFLSFFRIDYEKYAAWQVTWTTLVGLYGGMCFLRVCPGLGSEWYLWIFQVVVCFQILVVLSWIGITMNSPREQEVHGQILVRGQVMSCQSHNSFPWKCIWRSKVPLKVTFFGWKASHGKILLIEDLRKCGLIILETVPYL